MKYQVMQSSIVLSCSLQLVSTCVCDVCSGVIQRIKILLSSTCEVLIALDSVRIQSRSYLGVIIRVFVPKPLL